MPDAPGDHEHRDVPATVGGAASQVTAAARGGVGGRRGQDGESGPGEGLKRFSPMARLVRPVRNPLVLAPVWGSQNRQVNANTTPNQGESE